MSRSASTTISTDASCSARVVTTCSSPVRNDTGQLIRRNRSPGAKGRIPANSVPLPTRLDRWAPTSPSGCGASAVESYAAACGHTVSCWAPSRTGP